jgi:hypothetical protein
MNFLNNIVPTDHTIILTTMYAYILVHIVEWLDLSMTEECVLHPKCLLLLNEKIIIRY